MSTSAIETVREPHRRVPKSQVAAIPLNTFGISFGLSGLSGTWSEASRSLGAPPAIADVLWAVAGLAWVVTIAVYLRRRSRWAQIRDDLHHPVLGPFAALVPVTGMLLGGHLHALWPITGSIVVGLMVAISAAFGAWFVAQLLISPRGFPVVHGGYFLPTVAAGLISAQSLATIGADDLVGAFFGVGILFWLFMGALVVTRAVAGPELPGGLLPSLAIFAAPPAVAGNAWWVMTGGVADHLTTFFAGTMTALIAPILFLFPRFRAQTFSVGFWAFTFTTSASGTFALRLLDQSRTLAADAASWTLLGIVNAVIVGIAARTIMMWGADQRRGR